MKKVALYGGLLALLGAGAAYGAGQFPGYPLLSSISGFEYVPADTGAVAAGASFTGSISGTTLTATGISGTIYAGQNIVGANVAPGTAIVSGSGGTWTVSVSQTVSSTAMTSGGGGVNPQTAMIQTQQLKAYVLTSPVVTGVLTLPIYTIANATTACTASAVNSLMLVSDGTAYAVGTYGSAVGATGAVKRVVLCTAAATLVYN